MDFASYELNSENRSVEIECLLCIAGKIEIGAGLCHKKILID
jgi:hypothetical protein